MTLSTSTPSDLTSLEVSRTPLTSFLNTHLFKYLVVVLLGIVGYVIAPHDLAPGEYVAGVRVTLDGETLEGRLPFSLNHAAGEEITIREDSASYILLIKGQTTASYAVDQSIRYMVQVQNRGGEPIDLPLSAATSTLNGPSDYSQVLPPTDITEDRWLIFSMRVPYRSRVALTLLMIVAALWLLEPIPLAGTALLIPVVVVVGGIADAKTILQPYFHPIIVLFLAGFLMAEAMRRTGVDRMIALAILKRSSKKPAMLMLTLMSIAAFLSMWMSNTASVAIIIPIALAILQNIPDARENRAFQQAMVLGVAYAASVGGIGSAIGTPANILAMTFLSEFAGAKLAFADWFAYGLPFVIVMIPLIWRFLLLTFGVGRMGITVETNLDQLETEKPGRRQWVILGIFVVIILLWLTEEMHGLDAGLVALGGAVVLFLLGLIEEEDFNHINWNALITFGGGLAIGNTLVTTGVSDWVALRLIGLSALPPMLVVFLVAALTLLLGAFISNTACAAMMIPMAIPLAQILQIDPCLMVVVIAIGSSIDFALVIGTPPTMMAYSTGMFKSTGEIARRGVVLDVIGLLLLSLGVIWIWQTLGVVKLF